MDRRTLLKSAAATGLMGTLAACAAQTEGNDIVDIAAANPDFSALVAALGAAGLVDTLRGEGPFTVFAPTNAAFDALPPGTVEELLLPENEDQLRAILLYHVVPGNIMSNQLLGQELEVATVMGETVNINGMGGKGVAAVRVNDANVIQPDIIATNGVIHVIDKVLLP